jgi:cyclopropane-fatty-acyl-phospholipid synthase
MQISLRSRRWDRRAIAHHYDLPAEFYALFLDRRMVYTCGYYRRPDGDLDQAQEDKLDVVCRKLKLAAGERFLDLGCGWGGLVLWAAERYDVEAHGVTLSRAQAEYAQAAIRRLRLGERVRVDRLDCRDLRADGRYDKVAAVGFLEHLPRRQHVHFFERVRGLLAPGGLFLNHCITQEKHAGRSSEMRFLRRHVFPGGALASVSDVLDGMERARFEILDVEGLRLHYARTTRQWVERLQVNATRAKALVGERVYRTWVAYLAGASVAFTQGAIGLHQTVSAPLAPGSETRATIGLRP